MTDNEDKLEEFASSRTTHEEAEAVAQWIQDALLRLTEEDRERLRDRLTRMMRVHASLHDH